MPSGDLRETISVFARLGVIAFGGPVAHIAMMREELVRRRGWVDDQRFVDLMGATNLIPGPNSTELAMHLGHERAGWRGLLAAGLCFILPAATIVTFLAWIYVRYGTTPSFTALLYGVVPVVLGIVAHALVSLVPTVFAEAWRVLLAVAALVAFFVGVNELLILAVGGAVAGVSTLRVRGSTSALVVPLAWFGGDTGQLSQLFWTMLKIGAVLYGSGYVLLAFLEGDFVDRLGWISQQQLLDAVAIGQVTPGPLFTTATFIGYLVAGVPGAFVATVAIFAPSFVFVGLLTRITDHLRSRTWTARALDGLNAAAFALMVGVTWQLGRGALVDPVTVLLALGALAALRWTSLNSAWLIAAGALIGLLCGLG
ncbi:chromate efflux transporter [Nocardioides sp. Bht2]|uniref:chromate efflux transporter n=1 Tax=Nocardioides sp. Bht2 TaxID=3392297 RepID=UPI0039B397A1